MHMANDSAEPRSFRGPPIRPLSIAIVILSVIGVAIGLIMMQSLSRDVRASTMVSNSALDAIGQTIETIDGVADGTSASLDSTSASVSSASSTLDGAVTAIEGVADFLDEELPATLDSIQMSMPAAIQTANAVDGTLRALSFVGVDYDPEEPFGESLSRVNTALSSLPDEIRIQSETLRLLIPSAEQLSADTDSLSTSLDDLREALAGFTSLTETYETTISDAETTIVETTDSIDTSIWMIRALIVGAGVVGILVGLVLWSLAQRLDDLAGRVELLHHERPRTEAVAQSE